MTPKERVLEWLITSFLAKYVRLDEARVATLAGRGSEAKIWLEKGIARERGYLVDRSRARINALQKSGNPYRLVQADLGLFQEIYRALHASGEGLDYFHLDLNGTLESEEIVRSIVPTLTLLADGRARCLAITVIDVRENRSLTHDRELVERVCPELFGSSWPRLRDALVLLQKRRHERRPGDMPGGDEDNAMREASTWFYLLLSLASIEERDGAYHARERGVSLSRFLRLRAGGTGWREVQQALEDGRTLFAPDHINRLVYWPGMIGHRMRSYAIHLKRFSKPMRLKTAATKLAEMILQSDCRLVDRNGMVVINATDLQSEGEASASEEVNRDQTQGGGTKMDKRKELKNATTVAQERARLAPMMAALRTIVGERALEWLFKLAEIGERAESGGEVDRLRLENAQLRTDLGDRTKRLSNIYGIAMGGVGEPRIGDSVGAFPKDLGAAGGSSKPQAPKSRSNGVVHPVVDSMKQHLALEDALREPLIVVAEREGLSSKAFEDAGKVVKARLGWEAEGVDLRRKLGSFVAHGRGQYRPRYVHRVLSRLDPEKRPAELERLAYKVYRDTAVETLRQELKDAGLWSEEFDSMASGPTRKLTKKERDRKTSLTREQAAALVLEVLREAGPKKDTVAYKQSLEAALERVAPKIGVVIEGNKNWKQHVYMRLMKRACGKLWPDWAALVLLTDERTTSAEIAGLLGVKPSTVVSRVQRTTAWQQAQKKSKTKRKPSSAQATA